MTSKPLIIYHDSCADGFASAFAAWLALGDGAEYFPCNYGKFYLCQNNSVNGIVYNNKFVAVYDRIVIMTDFSMPPNELNILTTYAKYVEIHDHHISAYKALFEHQGVRKDNVLLNFNMEKAGCWLSWERFHNKATMPHMLFLIGLRDLWQHKGTDLEKSAEALNLYLNSMPFDFHKWKEVMDDFSTASKEAEGMLKFFLRQVEIAKGHAIHKEWHWLENIVKPFHIKIVNAPYFMASELGNQLAKECDFAIIWSLANDGSVLCSLRSQKDRGTDVSEVAGWFGGGGHKNAAGCKFDSLQVFAQTFL